MTTTIRDAWRYLRGNLIVAAVLTISGAILLSIYSRERESSRLEFDHTSKALREVRERYQLAAKDEPEIRHMLQRYEALHQKDLIGTENRLDWTDRLRSVRKQNRIPKLEFELAPQQVLFQVGAQNEYTFMASTMVLHAELLHEGDFLEILANLRSDKGALVVPRRCHFSRIASDEQERIATTLRASCTLDWITLKANSRSAQILARAQDDVKVQVGDTVNLSADTRLGKQQQ